MSTIIRVPGFAVALKAVALEVTVCPATFSGEAMSVGVVMFWHPARDSIKINPVKTRDINFKPLYGICPAPFRKLELLWLLGRM
jgi:hypothetical protein